MPRRDRSGAAHAVVRELFTEPPVSRGELKTRLSGVGRDDLRRALLDTLEAGEVKAAHQPLFLAAIAALKPGGMRGRLSALVLDGSRPRDIRETAYNALVESDGAEARRVSELLPDDELATLMAAPLRRAAGYILEDDAPGAAFLSLVGGQLEAAAPAVVFEIESERASHGVSASELYGEAIAAGLLRDLRPSLVPIVAADRSEEAAQILERMRDDAGDDDALRIACATAAMKLRTALAARDAPQGPPVTGRAWVTTCDGQGAFTVIATIDGGPRRGITLANCCMRASAEIRDGFHEPDPEQERIDWMFDHLRQFCRVVSLPLDHAARLVADAADRTERMNVRLPRDAKRPVQILSRIAPADLPPWPAPPGRAPDEHDVALLIAANHHLALSWWFDRGDLSGTSAPEVPRDPTAKALDEWTAAAARAIDVPDLRARVVEMARHEARCLAWSGRIDEAGIVVALGQQAEAQGLERSALARGMLRRSVERLNERFEDDDDDEMDLPYGDPKLRRSLRAEFFHDVEKATGRDLLRLDLTEVALLALDEAIRDLPGARRPRAERVHAAAFHQASLMADRLARGAPAPDGSEREQALRRLGVDLDLAGEDADLVGLRLALHFREFLLEACDSCAVRCMDRPGARVDGAFHADEHPAFL